MALTSNPTREAESLHNNSLQSKPASIWWVVGLTVFAPVIGMIVAAVLEYRERQRFPRQARPHYILVGLGVFVAEVLVAVAALAVFGLAYNHASTGQPAVQTTPTTKPFHSVGPCVAPPCNVPTTAPYDPNGPLQLGAEHLNEAGTWALADSAAVVTRALCYRDKRYLPHMTDDPSILAHWSDVIDGMNAGDCSLLEYKFDQGSRNGTQATATAWVYSHGVKTEHHRVTMLWSGSEWHWTSDTPDQPAAPAQSSPATTEQPAPQQAPQDTPTTKPFHTVGPSVGS